MQPFVGRRLVRSGRLRLAAPPGTVFPLFGPIEERRWAEGWAPTMIHPPSGEVELGAVFTVEHDGGAPSVWTIVELDPQRFRISYVRVRPDSHLARIDIACAGADDGATRADVTYTFTGLAEPGNALVDSFTEAHYTEWMRSWELAISQCLSQLATLTLRRGVK